MVALRERVLSGDLGGMVGQRALLAGWLQDLRDQGKIAFLFVRDRQGVTQVVLKKTELGEERYKAAVSLPRESVVAVQGMVAASKAKAGGCEVVVDAQGSVEVLSQAAAPLPLGVVDKVQADLDTRLDNRFMDVRKPEVAAIFRVRSVLVKAGVDYFASQGFVQIHTPRIIGASSEGGTELYPVKYFEKDAYLAQSPQLYKQAMMATGLDRVFEVATYFRAEKHNTYRHLNEITAFDAEMAFIDDEEDVMRILEGACHHIWQRVAEECGPELALRGVDLKVPSLPFPRVPHARAVEMVNASGKLAAPIGEQDDLSTEAERVLGELMGEQGHIFYFITKYPGSIRPFYTYVDADGTSRSFDLEHKGLEVTSGAQRQHQVQALEQRLKEKGLDPADFESYLKAFRYGMPPHGGFGLGIDRLTMEVLGLDNVREAVLFPRDRTRVSP
ncbi:MAG TPA: aspartate--tRNA(Asn) ligase [Candidatus Thermoplasmatota archaeon]|jgi:aspartyl-tRNA synthetase|nr:aspartate--tRNA(Asn) ligase [Candidatus Thermoplasmatota archaeon]